MMGKLRIMARFPVDLWQAFITSLPGPVGQRFRYAYWRRRLKSMGRGVILDIGAHFINPEWISLDDGCWIDRSVLILAGPPRADRITHRRQVPNFPLKTGEVSIGKQTHIAPNCVISGMGGVRIGSNCGVASNSAIYSLSHHYRNLTDTEDPYQYSFTPLARPDQQAMVLGPIWIQEYCAIGLCSVLLPGTVIGKGSWVATHGVVSGAFPEQTLITSTQSPRMKSMGNLTIKT